MKVYWCEGPPARRDLWCLYLVELAIMLGKLDVYMHRMCGNCGANL